MGSRPAGIYADLENKVDSADFRTQRVVAATDRDVGSAQVISSSPGELEPVFEKMSKNATRVCGANFGTMIFGTVANSLRCGTQRSARIRRFPAGRRRSIRIRDTPLARVVRRIKPFMSMI